MNNENHIGLIFSCPYLDEMNDCPFKEFRLTNCITKRLYNWNEISESEFEYLIHKHIVCFASRENGASDMNSDVKDDLNLNSGERI